MIERAINMKAKKYMEIQSEIKELEKQLEKLKVEMTEAMNEDVELATNKYILKWPVINGSRFDTKTFKVEHPDLYNIFNKENPYRKFSVVEKGA